MNLNLDSGFVGIIRAILFILAALFQTGTIPTGIDGGGEKVAIAIMAAAVSLAAGDKNPPPLA